MNKYAEYLWLAIERHRVLDSEALCRKLQRHLETNVSRQYGNRIRSLGWSVTQVDNLLLITLFPGGRDWIHFRRTSFFGELIEHTLQYSAPLATLATPPRLVFTNDEIGIDDAMKNPVTWTLEKLQNTRKVLAGLAVEISDFTSSPASVASVPPN